jgi:hypothetical protein
VPAGKSHIIRDLFWMTRPFRFALVAVACSSFDRGPGPEDLEPNRLRRPQLREGRYCRSRLR